ncbi:MAG: ATP synthase F1 subunit gamma [Muribaculaceae bacterium]|nr:ATP synthase F1 subunit gamma [Muribaculaceae bacterium]
MATLRELKGRIGSVKSSEKITGAMKMISSAKMRKAEMELRRLLPFRSQIETIIGNLLSADAEFSSPLTQISPVERMAIVVLGSDDGLCGAYNVNIYKHLLSHIADMRDKYGTGLKIEIYPVGKKMLKTVSKLAGDTISIHPTPQVTSKSSGESVKQFNAVMQEKFLSGAVNRVDIVYMNYISVSRQRPRADKMLPVAADSFSKGAATSRPYLFEPNASVIFRTALPMYLLSMTEEVFGENRASEQAARVMAMQSANDNAKKLLEQLQLEYNKLRQQGITNELLDIVGGQARD